MNVALPNLLEDRSPIPSAAGAARRLRDLWLAGLPLERPAAAAGLTVTEAEGRLHALGYQLGPEASTFDVEVLRRLYEEERLSVAEVAARQGWTEGQVRGRLRRAGIRAAPRRCQQRQRAGIGAGSRWSARGAARTNDLYAVETRCHLRTPSFTKRAKWEVLKG